jgi:hypothetical protein
MVTIKELTEIVDISYDALKKLVRRMVTDGEIDRKMELSRLC